MGRSQSGMGWYQPQQSCQYPICLFGSRAVILSDAHMLPHAEFVNLYMNAYYKNTINLGVIQNFLILIYSLISYLGGRNPLFVH